MQVQMNQASAPTEYHFGPEVFSMDTIADPARAAKWVRMCSATPALMNRFTDLFVAAQLTLLGNGETPELALC